MKFFCPLLVFANAHYSTIIPISSGQTENRVLSINARAAIYDDSTGLPIFTTSYKDLVLSTLTNQTVHYEIPVEDYSRLRTIILPTINGGETELSIIEDDEFYSSTDWDMPENGVIGISPRSKFSLIFSNFLISPNIPQRELHLHLRPSNPSSLCAQSINYIETIAPHDSWKVTMIPRVLATNITDDAGIYHPLDTGEEAIVTTSLGYEVLSYETILVPIIEAVESASSGNYVRDSGKFDTMLEFSNCQSLDSFPKIIYGFYNAQGRHVVDVVLEPSDYALVVTESGSSQCITFLASPESSSYTHMIGANIFNSVAVHFDAANDRIGFCDPP